MAKQCDGANCTSCEKWQKSYIAPNKDFHLCIKFERFTRKDFYCSDHENNEEADQRRSDARFDNEYA